MTAENDNNLSGYWTGIYDYSLASKDPVPFNVVITDETGSLSGEFIEPNTFAKTPDRELFASLSGARDGMNVHFIKTYERVPRAGHSVIYEGTLDSTFNRIEGQWRAPAPCRVTGSFIMNRTKGSGAKAEKMAERELELMKGR